MNKFLPIFLGVIIFLIVMVGLKSSQSKQIKLPELQNEISLPTVQPANSNNLSVFQPQSGITVKNAHIKVIGKTTPNAEVFINNIDAVADAKGNFSADYTLEEGENYILVGATDAFGKYSEKELVVTYSF